MKGVFLFLFLLTACFSHAQRITKDIPFSFLENKKNEIKSLRIKPLDLKKIQKEDSIEYQKYQQFNVGRLQKVDVNFEGLQGKEKNLLFWKYRFDLDNAKNIAIRFKNLRLPKGTKLYIYSQNQKTDFLVYSADMDDINQERFISRSIKGQSIIIEYNQESFVKALPTIEIDGFVNYYISENRKNPGFGQSTDCEVNVACEEADGWCNEIESVLRILIQSGTHYSYCSGAVVNNTRQDFTPYVLTAGHCGEASREDDFNYWKFDFDYQSETCQTPSSELEIDSKYINGCEMIAKAERRGSLGSDFRLLRLLDSIPKTWNIYYAGWDVEDKPSITGGGVGIHHPYGDIKKISTYSGKLESSDASGGQSNDLFWRTYWDATENGHGITEGGSSGSPLFNNRGLIIGTLATGLSYCDNQNESSPDFYGKMCKHWDANGVDSTVQLKYWLDPLHLNVDQWGGISGNISLECGQKISFDNFVLFPNPASTVLYIGNSDSESLQNAIVRIYNSSGMLVKSGKTNTTLDIQKVDICGLLEGVYIIEVQKEDWMIQKKFVILR